MLTPRPPSLRSRHKRLSGAKADYFVLTHPAIRIVDVCCLGQRRPRQVCVCWLMLSRLEIAHVILCSVTLERTGTRQCRCDWSLEVSCFVCYWRVLLWSQKVKDDWRQLTFSYDRRRGMTKLYAGINTIK